MAGHGKAQQVRIAKMRERKAFSGGNLTAVVGSAYNSGQMPIDVARAYMNAANDGLVAYTVLSYSTPIAYVLTSGEVIIPDVKYSQSTTCQQNEVTRALLHTY